MKDTLPTEIEVFYDGGCPICVWEVDLYGRMDKSGAIAWVDIEALDDAGLPTGKTREELLGKFHVRETGGDGGWHIGVDAFSRIWRVLPGFKYAWWIFRVPVIRQLAEVGYRGFLAWQRRDRARRNKMLNA
ncbi:MAG: DUF393 domain-containing protein [Pseudomonadota bacterium]